MLKHAVMVGVLGAVALIAAQSTLGWTWAPVSTSAKDLSLAPSPKSVDTQEQKKAGSNKGLALALAISDPDASPSRPQRAAQVRKAADGHFWARGESHGEEARFLVDTGATTVALTLDDAKRFGLDVTRLSFRQTIATAAGQARAAPVTLDYLAVGPARVERVEALVIEQGLPSSLLGMSYLGRLKGFEADQHALILRP